MTTLITQSNAGSELCYYDTKFNVSHIKGNVLASSILQKAPYKMPVFNQSFTV